MTTAPTAAASNQAAPATFAKKSLKPEDFINMMITQLQHQDPLEPSKSDALLSQMSQIGQLQSTTDLQASLKTLVLQNNLSSAGNMIGKQVRGLDDKGAQTDGVVRSVQVRDGGVWLELESGKSLDLGRVTEIAPAGTGADAATAAADAAAA